MILLTPDPIRPGALLEQFCQGRSETGAITSFTGLARADQGQTSRLELEAYPGFTERQIADIAQRVQQRFLLQDIMIVHRIGLMAPGEPIVFVATASAHRRAAFEACDCLMDYLKSKAPFWKRQSGPQSQQWVEPTMQDRTDAARWDLTGEE